MKQKKPATTDLTLQETIEHRILLLRGKKVMIDRDLAILYGVKAIRLREQVKRNKRRFPQDFMFQLTSEEVDVLVSQNAIPSKRYLGGYLPFAFTEQGIAMLSSVLNSEGAILVNIQIMRTFTKLRQMAIGYAELNKKIKAMERKYGQQFRVIFEAIRKLWEPPEKEKRKIGFHTG